MHSDLQHFRIVKAAVEEDLAAGLGTMPHLGVVREVWVEDDRRRARWFRRRYRELWHHHGAIENAESPFQTEATARTVTVQDTGTGPGVATQDPGDLAEMAIIGAADEVAERL